MARGMFGVYLRTVNKNVRLVRELREVRLREQARDHRIARLHAELEKVRGELDQSHRDSELLALMAKDRTVALEFVRDQHRIDGLDEGAA